jgi:hypothetical protein
MNDNAMLIPSGWMFKAPKELLYEYDPASFAHTKDVDVYAFANTAYTVSPCLFSFDVCIDSASVAH